MKQLLAAAIFGVASISAFAQNARIEAAITALAPGAAIERISETRMPGIHEVVVQGRVVYVSADGKYLFQGTMLDVENRTDLTEATKAGLRRDALGAVEPAQRIVYKAKDEKHAITVFTDVDCGYCRRLHQEIAEHNARGVTVEYLFFPRAGIGSASYDTAVSVWCTDDRKQAMDAAQAGGALEKKDCAENPVARGYELGRKFAETGTPAIFTAQGEYVGGYLPPAQLLQRLETLVAAR